MLGSWQLHDEYLAILHKYDAYVLSDPISAAEWAALKPLRRKLANLNVDSLHDFFSGFFSSTGRPANLQPQIFRSFILMSLKGYTSLTSIPSFCSFVDIPAGMALSVMMQSNSFVSAICTKLRLLNFEESNTAITLPAC